MTVRLKELLTLNDLEQLRHKERRADESKKDVRKSKDAIKELESSIRKAKQEIEERKKKLVKQTEDAKLTAKVFAKAKAEARGRGLPSSLVVFSPISHPHYLEEKIKAAIEKRAKARMASS